MDKDKLKKFFHSRFNEINNICIVAGSNRKILEEENLNELSSEELTVRISQLVKVLVRIEENAMKLNNGLRELYESLAKEKSPPAEGLPK